MSQIHKDVNSPKLVHDFNRLSIRITGFPISTTTTHQTSWTDSRVHMEKQTSKTRKKKKKTLWKNSHQEELCLPDIKASHKPSIMKAPRQWLRVEENVKQLEPLEAVGGDANWHNPWKPLWQYLLNTCTPYNIVLSLRGMDPTEMCNLLTKSHNRVFISELFITVPN